ncbi:MAG: ABC transporter permease [SAR324 cluster bacterium]|nr:ABC transporter permease [SAR324 cluster bacterium]
MTGNKKIAPLIIFLVVLFAIPFGLLQVGEFLEPYQINTSRIHQPPDSSQLFGTDSLGRDLFARTVYALGLSLKVSMSAFLTALTLAIGLGGIAGYFHGRLADHLISWLIALIYTVPFILIVAAVFAVFEPGLEKAYLAIGCLAWAAPARLVRAEVIQYRTSLFVTAERAFGFSEFQILFHSIIPLSFPPALISLLYFIPELISVEVGLSFFGFGAQPPEPSLGRLIYDGLSQFYSAWWMSLLPSAVLLIVVSTVYLMTHKLETVVNKY